MGTSRSSPQAGPLLTGQDAREVSVRGPASASAKSRAQLTSSTPGSLASSTAWASLRRRRVAKRMTPTAPERSALPGRRIARAASADDSSVARALATVGSFCQGKAIALMSQDRRLPGPRLGLIGRRRPVRALEPQRDPAAFKCRVRALGQAARRGDRPERADIEQLHVLLGAYGPVLASSVGLVAAEVGSIPSSRVKTTGTIVEKLRRSGGHTLSSMHDLGGMRLVVPGGRAEQDVVVEQVCGVFGGGGRAPKVIDRRVHPVQGYRAIHVIIYPDAYPIEVQDGPALRPEIVKAMTTPRCKP